LDDLLGGYSLRTSPFSFLSLIITNGRNRIHIIGITYNDVSQCIDHSYYTNLLVICNIDHGGKEPTPDVIFYLESVCRAIRTLHYSIRTEQAYLSWIKQYILSHGKCHPDEMSVVEVGKFISYLVNERRVSAATQNQALNALNFL
jgi:hypothetical protein